MQYSIFNYCMTETNLDKEHGNWEGYKPELKSKFYGKTKGSGLAILKDNLIQCTKNLESLFFKVTNIPKPVYFGVVYRPPSSESFDQYIAEFESKAYHLRMFIYLETITLTSLVMEGS